jgi:hypothetical protein
MTVTYFITIYVTGFIRFQILVFLPEEGNLPLKYLGVNGWFYNKKHIIASINPVVLTP